MIGHGIDLVEVPDFARLLVPPASQFIDRHFTHTELAAAGEGVERTQRLAARFAVKEAVMKALGVGWGAGIAFTDVEVVATARGKRPANPGLPRPAIRRRRVSSGVAGARRCGWPCAWAVA